MFLKKYKRKYVAVCGLGEVKGWFYLYTVQVIVKGKRERTLMLSDARSNYALDR